MSTLEQAIGNLQGRVHGIEKAQIRAEIDIRAVNKKLDRILYGMFTLAVTAGGHLLYLILTHKP